MHLQVPEEGWREEKEADSRALEGVAASVNAAAGTDTTGTLLAVLDVDGKSPHEAKQVLA